MPKLSYRKRQRLAPSMFALPKGSAAHPGRKQFPIDTESRARNALSRAAQRHVRLTKRERCQVVRAVCARYPAIGVCTGATQSKKLGVCRL